MAGEPLTVSQIYIYDRKRVTSFNWQLAHWRLVVFHIPYQRSLHRPFVYLSGQIYVWLCCKSPPYHRLVLKVSKKRLVGSRTPPSLRQRYCWLNRFYTYVKYTTYSTERKDIIKVSTNNKVVINNEKATDWGIAQQLGVSSVWTGPAWGSASPPFPGYKSYHLVSLCCLSPLSLRPLDVEFMRRLSKVVNIVPVIAKADTLTLEERDFFKKKVTFIWCLFIFSLFLYYFI